MHNASLFYFLQVDSDGITSFFIDSERDLTSYLRRLAVRCGIIHTQAFSNNNRWILDEVQLISFSGMLYSKGKIFCSNDEDK